MRPKSKYQEINSRDTLIAYKGRMGDHFLHCMLSEVEEKLQRENPALKLRKKVINIIIEVFQNIHHYLKHIDTQSFEKFKTIIFILGKSEFGFTIFVGNYVKNEAVSELRERIDKINELDYEELKKLYRFKLENGSFNAGGGAGLGIIDIARKSGTKISYNFEVINTSFSFFSLNIAVNQ